MIRITAVVPVDTKVEHDHAIANEHAEDGDLVQAWVLWAVNYHHARYKRAHYRQGVRSGQDSGKRLQEIYKFRENARISGAESINI